MADLRCPDCGSPVSPSAVVCSQCGFPLRPASLGRGGGPGRGVILGIAAAALVVLVGFGALMAVVGPKARRFTAEANQQQGRTLLKWAYVQEQHYYREHGTYTPDPDRFAGDGPRPDKIPFAIYALRVSAAGDRDLCLEAVPSRTAPGGTQPMSMDVDGNLYHAAGCTGESDAGEGSSGESADKAAADTTP